MTQIILKPTGAALHTRSGAANDEYRWCYEINCGGTLFRMKNCASQLLLSPEHIAKDLITCAMIAEAAPDFVGLIVLHLTSGRSDGQRYIDDSLYLEFPNSEVDNVKSAFAEMLVANTCEQAEIKKLFMEYSEEYYTNGSNFTPHPIALPLMERSNGDIIINKINKDGKCALPNNINNRQRVADSLGTINGKFIIISAARVRLDHIQAYYKQNETTLNALVVLTQSSTVKNEVDLVSLQSTETEMSKKKMMMVVLPLVILGVLVVIVCLRIFIPTRMPSLESLKVLGKKFAISDKARIRLPVVAIGKEAKVRFDCKMDTNTLVIVQITSAYGTMTATLGWWHDASTYAFYMPALSTAASCAQITAHFDCNMDTNKPLAVLCTTSNATVTVGTGQWRDARTYAFLISAAQTNIPIAARGVEIMVQCDGNMNTKKPLVVRRTSPGAAVTIAPGRWRDTNTYVFIMKPAQFDATLNFSGAVGKYKLPPYRRLMKECRLPITVTPR